MGSAFLISFYKISLVVCGAVCVSGASKEGVADHWTQIILCAPLCPLW